MSLDVDQLEKLTYEGPPSHLDHTLSDQNLSHHCPLDNGRHTLKPIYGLGALEGMPVELLFTTLVKLDVMTLTDFRRVNQRAMEVVDSMVEYNTVSTHAPDILRCILSIKTGRWITCQLLYDTFCLRPCEYCGDFGGYLYLLTCKRVCFLCFTDEKKSALYPMDRLIAQGRFRLAKAPDTRSWDESPNAPNMECLPGHYSPAKKLFQWSHRLFDRESARQAGIQKYGSAKAMKQHVLK